MKIQHHYQQYQQQHEPSPGTSSCRPSNRLLLLIYDDAVCFLLFFCEAFLWRGVWNLNATFMFSDLFLGGWVNHAAGTVIMMALQLFSYVGICGCARDDDVPTDEGRRWRIITITHTHTHTHTQTFNGPLSGTTRVSQYQKGKTNLDFTEARDSEWPWHHLGHMQACTSLKTDNYASTQPLSLLQAGCPFCRPTNSVKALKALLP